MLLLLSVLTCDCYEIPQPNTSLKLKILELQKYGKDTAEANDGSEGVRDKRHSHYNNDDVGEREEDDNKHVIDKKDDTTTRYNFLR